MAESRPGDRQDKNAPLVIGTHCQVFYYNSSLDITPSMAYGHSTVLGINCSPTSRTMHIISGHTHNNTTMKIRNGLMEHNTGGSCATWWWTGYYSNGHICKDGAPGGMGSTSSGTPTSNGTTRATANRAISAADLRHEQRQDLLRQQLGHRNMIRYYPDRNDYANVGNNVVYINVWGWDPEWKVSVKENGVELNPTRVYMKRPAAHLRLRRHARLQKLEQHLHRGADFRATTITSSQRTLRAPPRRSRSR